MEGTNNQRLTSEAMLAEARAFQREVTRGKDHRGHGGISSQKSGAYGSGAQTAAGTPRGASRQPAVAQNLATPEQFFGRQGHPAPAAPQNPATPATQQPMSMPVDNYEPMQVDLNPLVPKNHNEAAPTTGRGLVGSRWATSSLALNQAPPSMAPPSMAPPSMAPPVAPPAAPPVAPAYASIDTGRAGVTAAKIPTFPSSAHATLDTPEVPKVSKGLLSSKWAAGTSPASPSPMTMKYPDPSTLKPVYRSEDWLSDLSAEYKKISIKTKNTSESQPTQQTPLAQPAGVQTAAETVKTPGSESQQPLQDTTNFSAASQKNTAAQAANQAFNTHSGPSSELGRTTPSAQAANNQGGVFNDSAFKDWYNSQFMRRKA